jgi:predicted acyltransferase
MRESIGEAGAHRQRARHAIQSARGHRHPTTRQETIHAHVPPDRPHRGRGAIDATLEGWRSVRRRALGEIKGGRMQDRLVSLDAFRGFTIAAMLLVNNPGDWGNLYAPLAHAAWHGWTFTDTIFPSFLFIGGVSMTLSLRRRIDGGAAPARLLLQLWRRAALIFLIGFALNWIPLFDLASVRIPGVLQRIALCTALAAPLVVYCGWRAQLAWIAGLLALYSAVMLWLPVPGVDGVVAAGVLEPGRDAAAWIDRQFLAGHMWAQSRTWDPEGLFTTIPALCSQLLGVLAGRWLMVPTARPVQAAWMLVAGLAFMLAGLLLDAVLMPINKSLWTPSFCVLMTGWALLVFGAFYWLLDAAPSARLRAGAAWLARPFVIYGMNALFIFALSGLAAKMIGHWHLHGVLYDPVRALALSPKGASLAFAVAFDLAMFAVAWAMWRRRWFVKV